MPRSREPMPEARRRLSPYQIRIENSLTDFVFNLSDEERSRAGFDGDAVPSHDGGRHFAGRVWELFQVTHLNGYTTCQLCGHYPIRRLFWIRCQITQEERVIGSECARNYVPVDLVNAYMRRLVRAQGREAAARARREQIERRNPAGARQDLQNSHQIAQRLHQTAQRLHEERFRAWCNTHPELYRWLTMQIGPADGRFLNSIREVLIRRRALSASQTNTCYRIARERGMTFTHSPAIPPPPETTTPQEDTLPEPAPQPPQESETQPDDLAMEGQAWERVPDCQITFQSPRGEPNRIQIYTVRRGQLQGHRIVKRWDEETRTFQGFAFLTTGGQLRLWRRFQGEEAAVEMVRRANEMLRIMQTWRRSQPWRSQTSVFVPPSQAPSPHLPAWDPLYWTMDVNEIGEYPPPRREEPEPVSSRWHGGLDDTCGASMSEIDPTMVR